MRVNKNKKCRHRIDILVAYTWNKDFMGTHEEGRHLQDKEAEASEETRFLKIPFDTGGLAFKLE